MGVNLIYGAFYKHDDPLKIMKYLYDGIDKDAIEIDTINFSGSLFTEVDNRLMSLDLVKNGMTEAVMFGPDGKNILPKLDVPKEGKIIQMGTGLGITVELLCNLLRVIYQCLFITYRPR